jgi:hypothetical protein
LSIGLRGRGPAAADPGIRLPARLVAGVRGEGGLGAIQHPSMASRAGSKLASLVVNGVSILLRLGSRIACLIVLVSFGLFVIDQAGNASAQQQLEVNKAAPAGTATPAPKSGGEHKKSGVRQAIDEASSDITSPFAGATSGWKNEWAIRVTLTVLALLVYGFGIGFLARTLRVRV